MQLPKLTRANYSGFLNDIKRGQIKIPRFQRDFVWSVQKSAALIDSVVKGYPVRTFIFWATKEHLRHIRDIGSESLPPPKKETGGYVLDGQQRITSLYAPLKGFPIMRDPGRTNDLPVPVTDLGATDDGHIVTIDVDFRG